jgi:hypothetical protein
MAIRQTALLIHPKIRTQLNLVASAARARVRAPVREALIELSRHFPEGVGAADLAEYFERRGGGPTEKQVRAALKLLTNAREANRVSRGRYLPRAMAMPAGEENSGDNAPEPLNLEAAA